MKLDELQSVRDRERQTDKLQQLRESFYADAGELIQQLRTERDRAAERADNPYDAPEVQQLTDEINTAEQTVENIYEKRVGKIVKAASFAAADLPAEVDGMTAEEQDLFETLVSNIKGNRQHVLDVLAGEESPTAETAPADAGESTSSPPEPSTEQQSSAEPEQHPPDEPATADAPTETTDTTVSAADVMGADADQSPVPELGGDDGESSPDQEGESPPVRNDGGTPAGADGETTAAAESGAEAQESTETDHAGAKSETVNRETVRITDDVQTFVGFDDREYDLSTNDVVQLPETNVGPLLEQGVAEQLR